MIFLGSTFCGGKHTLDATATNVERIKLVSIQNGIFDELYITKNTMYDYKNPAEKTWDFDTILHALFQGDLHAGNIKYTVGQVTSIRIKRREIGKYNWITLHDIPINKVEDFDFDRYDRFARSQHEYEYAIVPVLNTIEGNINKNTIKCEFDGVFIMEKNQSYNTDFELKISSQRNKPTSTITTLGNKYPFVICNGESNFVTGNITAFFAPIDKEACVIDTAHAFTYRDNLDDYLQNGRPKIIKLADGRMWLAAITQAVVAETSGHEDFVTSNIGFTEIGNADSSFDLYQNGFIDVNVEGDLQDV